MSTVATSAPTVRVACLMPGRRVGVSQGDVGPVNDSGGGRHGAVAKVDHVSPGQCADAPDDDRLAHDCLAVGIIKVSAETVDAVSTTTSAARTPRQAQRTQPWRAGSNEKLLSCDQTLRKKLVLKAERVYMLSTERTGPAAGPSHVFKQSPFSPRCRWVLTCSGAQNSARAGQDCAPAGLMPGDQNRPKLRYVGCASGEHPPRPHPDRTRSASPAPEPEWV